MRRARLPNWCRARVAFADIGGGVLLVVVVVGTSWERKEDGLRMTRGTAESLVGLGGV